LELGVLRPGVVGAHLRAGADRLLNVQSYG